MHRLLRSLLPAARVAAATSQGLAQPPGALPPEPVHVDQGPPVYTSPVVVAPPPGPVVLAPTTYVTDSPRPPVPADPGVPFAPPPGLYLGLETGLALPTLSHWDLQGYGVRLPRADQDLTVLPVFDVGFRFDDGNAVQFAYRYLSSSGTDQTPDGPLHSRLEDNLFDFDYVTREYDPSDQWRVQWSVGIRLASVLMDNQAVVGPDVLGWSNLFTGAGPHGTVGASRFFGDTGLALFGKVDGGLLFGTGRQRIDWDGPLGEFRGPELAPTLNVQAGLSWTIPLRQAWIRLSGGYQFEEQWFTPYGHNHDQAFFTNMNLMDHGPFLRCEVSF